MSVAVERLDEHAVLVSVAAPLDYEVTQRLDETLRQVAADGVLRVAIDLSQATPMDDAAIGVLFRALRTLRPAGGVVALAVPDAKLRTALGVMGLDRVFRVTETRQDACALVSRRGA
jgi:anti-anti-sigma factor